MMALIDEKHNFTQLFTHIVDIDRIDGCFKRKQICNYKEIVAKNRIERETQTDRQTEIEN